MGSVKLGEALMARMSRPPCPPQCNHCIIVVPLALDLHLRGNGDNDTTISRKRGQGGRTWRLRPIIAWYCCHLIAVAIVGGIGSSVLCALLVREEEELPSLCAATAAENGHDNWRGQQPDGYCYRQLLPR
jgi:hypothetical protein